MSKAASVAPARLFAVPKRMRPLMVKVRVGPCSRMRTVLADREVVLLRRAEVHGDVVRRRRCLALHDVQGGDLLVGVELDPQGGCPAGRDRPCRRGGCTGRSRSPSRWRPPRPGPPAPWRAATRGRDCASRCRRCRTGPPRAPGSRRSGRCSRTSVSNVLCSVSVSTNVPAMNVTPSTMASAVSDEAELVGQQSLDGDPPHVRRPACGCARAPSPASARPARRRPCRRPGRRPGRRRTPRGGRGSP